MFRLNVTLTMIAAGGLCGPGAAEDDKTARPSHSASAAVSSVSASGSAQSGASGSAAVAPTPGSKLAGSWTGELESKKAQVSLDPGVKDRAWAADDGRPAAGKGTLELTIEKDGTVTGRIAGALGPGTLGGAVEDDQHVSVSLTPSPDAEPAMAGTLVLAPSPDGNELSGTLRASSGSGEVVREAAIKLKRRPDP